ncbi:unnamed protein product, partial [Brassica oleracea]
MRTLVYTVHQTLTPRLLQFRSNIQPAKRRGHSQVTPLHVTSTILTSTRSNFFSKGMSQISSSHFLWSPNSTPFSLFPSSRALFQRFLQQDSHQSKQSVSDSTLARQRFGRSSEESTCTSEEMVCRA